MPPLKPQRITFDTNVCNVIHDPNKWPTLVTPGDAQKIRTAVTNSQIQGFVSEGSLFVECLSFPDKLAYLAVAGTPNPRPQPDARMVALFGDLVKLGMKLLQAPLIGGETFINGFDWADDEVFSKEDRQNRFSSFIQPLPRQKPLRQYGESLTNQPPRTGRHTFNRTQSGFSVAIPQNWAIAIKQEWDSNPAGQKALERAVRPHIGEWCDALILGSHYGYGNDIFCTTDNGKNAGSRSLLHHSNRATLQAQGITMMTPAELIQYYKL
jgi:hypothetical protein